MTLFLEEPELLSAFRRGDRDAFRTVYLRYDTLVWKTLSRFRTGASLSEHDCQDIHADTFARAFVVPARLSYDGQRPYSAYITTIAKNEARDWLRRHRRRVNLDFDEVLHSDPEGFIACDTQLDFQRAAEATRLWLEQQPKSLRDYVTQRFIEGTSQRDMEKVGGISRRNARTRDAQSLNALKAYLDAQGIAWRKLFGPS